MIELTQSALHGDEAVEIHDRVFADVLWDDWDGRAARDDAKQIVPTSSNVTAVALNQFLQGDGHFLFHSCWSVDVARDAEQLRAGVSWGRNRGERSRVGRA